MIEELASWGFTPGVEVEEVNAFEDINDFREQVEVEKPKGKGGRPKRVPVDPSEDQIDALEEARKLRARMKGVREKIASFELEYESLNEQYRAMLSRAKKVT